jgi:hypothetical protein
MSAKNERYRGATCGVCRSNFRARALNRPRVGGFFFIGASYPLQFIGFLDNFGQNVFLFITKGHLMTFFGKVPDKTKKSSQKNYSKAEGLRIFF